MVFVDTNIFLYSAGGPHPFRDLCQRFLRALDQDDRNATSSTEVVQEILHVVTRKQDRLAAVRAARMFMEAVPNLLPVTASDMRAAIEIYEGNPGITARDAIHVATMWNNGIDTIASADRHFDAVQGIRRLDPRDL